MRRKKTIGGGIAAMAAFGLICAAGGSAEGASVRIGGGGIKKIGDPYYQFVFRTFIESGYEFRIGDSFTIHELASISPGAPNGPSPTSLTSQPSGDPSGPWAPLIQYQFTAPFPDVDPAFNVPYSDVTWINSGASFSNTSGGEQFAGEFVVQSWVSLPFIPEPYSMTLTWSSIVHDIATGEVVRDQGTVTLYLGVPEPASVVSLAAGLGLPAFVWLRRHRNRRRAIA